jgi:thiosulfate dehydrogenase (quinone) large subunit
MRSGVRTIAVARIVTGMMFVFFGVWKTFWPTFAYSTMQQALVQYIQHDAVGLYRGFLARVVAPHPVFFGYAVGIGELLIGLALVLGLWVRPAAIFGMLHMFSLVLATWRGPAPAPPWRYVANQLEHIPLLLLFAIFFAFRAGEKWGLDARSHAARHRAAAAD